MSNNMNVHEKLAEVNMALFGIQIPKSGHNKHKGFKYHELEDMIPPVTKECYNQRLSLEFPYADDVAILKIVNLDNPKKYIVYRLSFPELVVEEKNPNNKLIQAYGADITYLQRYLLKLAFPALSDKDVIDMDETQTNQSSSTTDTSTPKEDEVAELPMGELILQARDQLVKKGIDETEITTKVLKRTVLHLRKWTVAERRCILNYFKEKEASK